MNKTETWIYILLAVISTFLLIDRFLLPCAIVMGIMLGLLVFRDLKLRLSKLLTALLIIASLIVITLGMSIFPEFSKLINLNTSVKELLRVVVYIMVLQTMAMINLDIRTHLTVWTIITVITAVIVILQFTKIVDMNGMLISFYGYSKQFVRAEESNLSMFRGGSVFVNPNVFACFLAAMLANYLFALRFVKESVISKIIMFTLLMTSLILSGSRTGMVLALLLILYHVYSTSQKKHRVFTRNALLIVAALAVVVFVLREGFSIDLLGLSDLRMFRIEEGMEDSLGIKLELFTNMLKEMNITNLFFGYGAYDYTKNIEHMVDFDLGYFLTYFGLFGFGAYLLLLRGIYKWGDYTLAGRKKLNMMLILIMLVFGLTAGIYFNLRMFTVCVVVFMPSLNDMKMKQRLT